MPQSCKGESVVDGSVPVDAELEPVRIGVVSTDVGELFAVVVES